MKLKTQHILPLLLAVSLPGLGFFLSENTTDNNVPQLIEWAYTSLILASLWYLLNYSWRIEPLHKQILFIIFSTLIFFPLVSLISLWIGIRTEFNFELKEIIRIVFLILIFLTIQYGLKSQKKIESLKVEKEQISKENYKAQLQNLRNQMDPHFLFNSLNTLRSMVSHNDKNAEDFILNLSNFYRRTLQHNENSTLSLSEELSFLKSYLILMKSRNEEAIIFNMSNISNKYNTHRLPTFALQGIVENCFKHNSMSSKKPLNIEIISTNDGYVEVSNNIQERLTQQRTTGLGLKLLKRRYELLNITEGVMISKNSDKFNVKLKLIDPK